MANTLPLFGWATAVPTSTSQFYQAGSYLRNSAPAIGAAAAWVCTADGYPGTWIASGTIDNGVISTVTAAAALTVGSKTYNLTGAGSYTLFPAASLASGAEVAIVANAVTVTVVAASANTLVGATTLASVPGRFQSNGTNLFFRVS